MSSTTVQSTSSYQQRALFLQLAQLRGEYIIKIAIKTKKCVGLLIVRNGESKKRTDYLLLNYRSLLFSVGPKNADMALFHVHGTQEVGKLKIRGQGS